MSNIITAGNATNNGTSISSDTSGVLELKTGSTPTTALTIGTNQVVTFAQQPAGTFAGTGPAFSAYTTNNQSITASTNTKIQLNVKNFDTNSNFDSTTNYRFTPTVAGYYQINGTVMMASTVGTLYSIIFKNGSEWIRGSLATAIATSYAASSASSLVYFNGSTDYVELYAWFSATNIVSSQNNYTQFSGTLVRSA